jgi:hypothetical protein
MNCCKGNAQPSDGDPGSLIRYREGAGFLEWGAR